MHVRLIAAAAALLLAGNAFAGLKEYVSAPDDSYKYEITETREVEGNTVHLVNLTSQTWRGIVWTHWLTVIVPAELKHGEEALLLVDGGNNGRSGPDIDSQEFMVTNRIVSTTGAICGIIEQVPNQPLFDGKTEDEIIAYTHEQYVKGEGDDWPLLFPMVKSAVRAMDTMAAIGKEKHEADLKEFLLTGASKRGWTTWLAAAADKRVQAIAPIVIDVLNMGPQMVHQFNTYGGYSEQVADYTERDLQSQMDTEMGLKLLKQTDPYSFRDELTLPKLIVIGTNDPYWTVDAANLYYNDLKGDNALYYQANTEHDISFNGVASIASFFESFLNDQAYPAVTWEQAADSPGKMKVTWAGEGGKAVLWQATSPNRDFRASPWTQTALEGEGAVEVNIEAPAEGYIAYYVEVQYPSKFGLPGGACTKMTVLPDTFAPEGTRTYELKKLESAQAN